MKKLFLLDAYALIYRAYYALFRNPRVTSAGMNTSAIFGFINTLDDLLKKEKPTHLAVCFDPPGGHTFRHEMFADYKAGREKQPEDITVAIPYIKRVLQAMCIPVVEIPGYEADDVIGTLATRAAAEGYTVYMMTPDKDYGQLVTDSIFQYRPALKGQGFEVRGPQQVCERYGIDRPNQVIDLLALEGDASDNIPGCPGVGEKTAAKLITEFDSVEGLLSNTDKLKGKLKERVEENREQIILSKDLATIRTALDIDLRITDLNRCEANNDELRKIYEELEFRSFLAKLPSKSDTPRAAAPAEPSLGGLFDIEPAEERPAAPLGDYSADAAPLLERALKAERIALAIYAIGEEAMTATLRGAAIAIEASQAGYIPAERISELAPILARPDLTVITHDFKRDMLLLRRHGVEWKAGHYDTSLAHYLLQPELRHWLPDVAIEILGLETLDADDPALARKFKEIPVELEVNLVCQRADMALQLYEPLKEALRKAEISPELEQLEQQLAPVLAEMEWTGVRIDPTILAERGRVLSQRVAEMEEEAYRMAGHPFNISSPSQVGQMMNF